MPTRLNSQGCWCRRTIDGARYTVVNKFVALAFQHAIGAFQVLRAAPGRVPLFSAVIGTLDDLAEPRTGLRCINPVRIDRRTFYMINFPARKMRAADFPSFARTIRRQNRTPLFVSHEPELESCSCLLSLCDLMIVRQRPNQNRLLH